MRIFFENVEKNLDLVLIEEQMLQQKNGDPISNKLLIDLFSTYNYEIYML